MLQGTQSLCATLSVKCDWAIETFNIVTETDSTHLELSVYCLNIQYSCRLEDEQEELDKKKLDDFKKLKMAAKSFNIFNNFDNFNNFNTLVDLPDALGLICSKRWSI